MARGSVRKYCMCRDAAGREIKGCKKPHGTWGYVFDAPRDPDTGKRRQIRRKGHPSRLVAEAEMTRELAKVDAGIWVDDRGWTVARWLDQWLADLAAARRSPKTLANYRGHVRDVWRPRLGQMSLRDLRRRHIEEVLRDLAEPIEEPPEGLAGRHVPVRRLATVAGYHRTIRAALTAARLADLLDRNVAEGIRLTTPASLPADDDADEADGTVWDLAETARFLAAAAAHPWSALFEIAAYAGLRRAELLGARWSDLDPDGAGLTIRQSLVELASKDIPEGERACLVCTERLAPLIEALRLRVDEALTTREREDAQRQLALAQAGTEHKGLYLKRPKSAAGRRWVFLVAPAQAALAEHRLRQQADRDAMGPDYADHGLIFAQPDGTPIRPGHVTQAHHDLAASLELRPIRLHEMRDGTCALLLAGGVPLEVVSMILGHASTAVTRKHYAQVLRSTTARQMQEAVQLLDGHRLALTAGPAAVEGS